jgi:hypothetical protein
MSNRSASVWLDDELERRINARRITPGGRIRSFSVVAREALIKGLDALDREGPSRVAAISTHPAFNAASDAPKCA